MPSKFSVTGVPMAGGVSAGMPVALRPASCSVPPLAVPMAALMGLAAARSRGEFTRALMLAAASAKGLNRMRSPAAPAPVRLKVRPSMFCRLGSVRLVKPVVLPSDRRTTWPALGPVKRTS